jgi:hypothetical protein
VFAEKGKDIACIIVEPVAGNMNCILPVDGFLQGLREICDEHGTVLIFDEVMTGFRVAQGGAQEKFGVTPDLTTLGKVIGGGLPVGAFGGKTTIMECIAPLDPSTGRMQFILPATGSTIIQAISLPFSANTCLTCAKLLYSSVKVCLAKSAGTPAELGSPSVNAPEPAYYGVYCPFGCSLPSRYTLRQSNVNGSRSGNVRDD